MEARASTKRKAGVFGPTEWGLSIALVVKLLVLAVLMTRLL